MTTAAPVKTRDQIEDRHKWSLKDIFDDDAKFDAGFVTIEKRIADFSTLRGSLAKSRDSLLAALVERDELFAELERLIHYAGLTYHEDMSNDKTQGRWDRATTLSTRASEAASWFTPEVLTIPWPTLTEWMASSLDLSVYRHALADLFRQQKHVLSPREEELLAMAGEIASAPESVYSRFTNTNLDFPIIKDADNNDVLLSQARFGALIYSPDRRVRRDTFIGLHKTYEAKTNTLSALLSAQVKQHLFYARARGYASCMESALDGPNIPAAVYHNLIATVRAHADKLHRYVDMRKRLMGLDEIHGYDLYVPIVTAPEEHIPYDDAMKTIFTALAPLGEEYVATIRKAADARWIDVFETKDKRSGAYSWGSYLTHPYILLNYNGTVHDRSTIAHELGHAMHSWYTTRGQPIIYGDYSTFCAEVASTVNEVLLADYLLEHATSDTERLLILQQQIDSIRTTVFRQTLFAEFEMKIHEKVEKGGALTGDWLCSSYAKLLRDYYGPNLVIDDCAKVEGLRIPHFYRNFYVYTYATSHCAAINIAGRILTEHGARPPTSGPRALQGWKKFLSAGSSAYPVDILKYAGIDMATPAPIADTMQAFADLLYKFEQLFQRQPTCEQKS
jgi:oligoendopeptidase F